MKSAFTAALLGLSLFLGAQAARSPVQLEALRREVIESQGAKRAAAAHAEDAAGALHERAPAPEKRTSTSTISFANPAAAGASLQGPLLLLYQQMPIFTNTFYAKLSLSCPWHINPRC